MLVLACADFEGPGSLKTTSKATYYVRRKRARTHWGYAV
jgi:hypothetical protein